VVAYQLFTGCKPYDATTIETLFYKILFELPDPPHAKNPNLSPNLDWIFRRALAKNPEDRFPNCAEFAAALSGPPAATASAPPAQSPPSPEPPASRPASSRLLPVLAGLLLPLAALLAYLFWPAKPEPFQPPKIVEFVASRNSISTGEFVTLFWNVEQADVATIEPAVGSVTPRGSKSVSPSSSTAYRLIAWGPGGKTEQAIQVQVAVPAAPVPNAPPGVKIVNFSSDIEEVDLGQCANLQWAVQNAASVTLQPGLGKVPASSAARVCPASTTTYLLSARGETGEIRSRLVLSVRVVPPQISFSSAPPRITSGESARLAWSVSHATTVLIEPSLGIRPATGAIDIHPQETTQYRLLAVGPGGTARSAVMVAVAPKPAPAPVAPAAVAPPKTQAAAPAAPPNPGPFAVGDGVTAPVVIRKVNAEYTDPAHKARLQGSVLIRVIIDENGVPGNMEVLRPLGMGLDEKAMAAVANWRFRAGERGGKPVAVIATVEVGFHLR
jgi:TonB family protein